MRGVLQAKRQIRTTSQAMLKNSAAAFFIRAIWGQKTRAKKQGSVRKICHRRLGGKRSFTTRKKGANLRVQLPRRLEHGHDCYSSQGSIRHGHFSQTEI